MSEPNLTVLVERLEHTNEGGIGTDHCLRCQLERLIAEMRAATVDEWRTDADEYQRLAQVAKERENPKQSNYLDMEDDLRGRIDELDRWLGHAQPK